MSSVATFAAGCFWGVEAAFRRLPGVIDTSVGYTGGTMENPTYQDVCNQTTGHAEAVEVKYDPKKMSYSRLLHVFFSIHDPTTLNRQGPDIGDQYRSAVFYHSDAQRKAAEKKKAELTKKGTMVVTTIERAGVFWRAEEHHQLYHEKHGGTC
jgi:peptide-methionine (S)-S-oxide reductase